MLIQNAKKDKIKPLSMKFL